MKKKGQNRTGEGNFLDNVLEWLHDLAILLLNCCEIT